ncbi:MAG: ferrochelatase [Mariniblastus sp.]|nr:ferrochelatase [Mariniblastus sp.]
MESMPESPFDAILLISFGGPEGPDDVMPFLENVLRGKNVPRARMLEVAEHYNHFGGISPINQQNRELIAALKQELADHQIELPVYWGNRNWHPLIPDTLQQMQKDGIRNALAFFTSAYSCYSGCRQYRENIMEAQVGLGDGAPQVHKLRMFFNHPDYIAASVDRVREALSEIPEQRRAKTHFLFTAHSIPLGMAERCRYTAQLEEASRLVMEAIGAFSWKLVYQSRSGPPSQPWLEPDVCDYLESLKQESEVEDVVIMPIGFVSDHMEVLFDLDTEAKEVCQRVGLQMVRAKTVGIHPKFISMIRQLILERTAGQPKQAIGFMPANHDVCPVDCCLPGKRPGGARPSTA